MKSLIDVEIKGHNPKYFLKKILYHNINIYFLDLKKHSMVIRISKKDWKKLQSIPTIYKMHIIHHYGWEKWKQLGWNYRIWVGLFLLGIGINIGLSQFIWGIEIHHPKESMKKIIQKDLAELGIKKYNWKPSKEKENAIKKTILEKEKNIVEWIEIERVGCKYMIQIEEKKKEIPKEECIGRNVVAKKKANILEIHASSGEVMKKKGDYVEKGEILISGWIHNKEEIVASQCATGQIYGETWYLVKVLIPNTIIKEKLESKTSYGINLQLGTKEFDWNSRWSTYKKDVYNILDSSILPFRIAIGKYQKTSTIEKNYSTKNVDSIACKIAADKMRQNLSKEEQILEKKVLKKQQKNSKIEVEVFLRVKEDITDYSDLPEKTE